MKKPQAPIATVEQVTPESARVYLTQLHPSQRKLRERNVTEYMRSLKAKEGWVLQADAITFDVHGRLMNGQHRLTACVRAGIGFTAVVLRGAPEESMGVIDIGSNVRSIEFMAASMGSRVAAPKGCHSAVALELVDFEYTRFRALSKKEVIGIWLDASDETKRCAATLMNAFKRQRGSRAAVAAGVRVWRHKPDALGFLVDAFRNTPGCPTQAALLHNALQTYRNRTLTHESALDHAWFVFRAVAAWEAGQLLTVLRGPYDEWPVSQRTLAGVKRRVDRHVGGTNGLG